ncbi:MAG TPA: GNAT family N-acetyltransferase [Chitinophagaceae bacterium]|nr:GNAT family N-acetyltransferase [Chitinophagaceae bacterium]
MQDLNPKNQTNYKELESIKVSPTGGDLEGAVIRRAVKEDCKRLLELIYQLAVYEKAPEEMTVTQEHFEESGFGEKPVWWGLVAEVDGNLEGFALYYIRYSTWKGQRMYLEDFLVNEEMRGKGIGKLLFDRLVEEAKEKKFNGIVWQVLDWNEPAINFYKKYDGVNFDKEWLTCSINF